MPLTANVFDQNNAVLGSATVSWSSSHRGRGHGQCSQGLVTAVSNGTATITARSGSASATAAVTVMQSAGRIVIEPSSATLMSLGETLQLTASVQDANGQAVEGAAVTWSSRQRGRGDSRRPGPGDCSLERQRHDHGQIGQRFCDRGRHGHAISPRNRP